MSKTERNDKNHSTSSTRPNQTCHQKMSSPLSIRCKRRRRKETNINNPPPNYLRIYQTSKGRKKKKAPKHLRAICATNFRHFRDLKNDSRTPTSRRSLSRAPKCRERREIIYLSQRGIGDCGRLQGPAKLAAKTKDVEKSPAFFSISLIERGGEGGDKKRARIYDSRINWRLFAATGGMPSPLISGEFFQPHATSFIWYSWELHQGRMSFFRDSPQAFEIFGPWFSPIRGTLIAGECAILSARERRIPGIRRGTRGMRCKSRMFDKVACWSCCFPRETWEVGFWHATWRMGVNIGKKDLPWSKNFQEGFEEH